MVEGEEVQEPRRENPEDYEKSPWMLKEWRNFKGNVKKVLYVVGVLVGIYFMFKWFGWYFLLGLLPAPAWYFWALRQIDRESYTLIEFRIKGDEVDINKISNDTQTNIYQIPPDIWRNMKIVGHPFTPGNRIYICDKFESTPDDEEHEGVVYFADHPGLANMGFYTRIKLWLELKKKIPKMEEDLAIYKYNISIIAQERAIKILQKMKALDDFMDDRDSYRIVANKKDVLREVVTYDQ